MGVYLYPNNTETELKNAYIGIPNPTSIVLDKSSITLTTIGQTEQLTATIEPTISDHSITWSSDDTSVATVSTSGLVTCVTPGECTITATTVNGLTASCSVAQSRLPSAYQEVEYIQSTGTQYLVIGNSFSTDYKVEIDVQLTATGGDQLLFGCTTNYRFGINAYSSYFKTITGGNSWSNTKSEDANRHTFIMDKGTTYVDGTPYSSSYISYTYNFGLGLFDYNRIDGGTRFPAKEKLFSCKIYNGNTILHDLVPCYRKADSVIGMYDIVNDVFYTNSGSGTFTKGNDV